MKTLKIMAIAFLLGGGVVGCTSSNLSPTIGPMRIATEDNMLSVRAGEEVLVIYHIDATASKPYVLELCTPSGENVLRDAPRDHVHHHGLMFAVSVEGTSFWVEREDSGRQIHRGFIDTKITEQGGRSCASFIERVSWLGPAGTELLREVRTIEVSVMKDRAVTFLVWQSRLEPPAGKDSVTLGGAHYYGLGMRFVEWMDGIGQSRNADDKAGKIFRGTEKLLRSKWCAYSAELDATPVTVAMFDHPENPRTPATWFVMSKPFAYLSATMALHDEPLNVTRDNPLVLRYAVALWDEHVETETINELYNCWSTSTK